MRILCIYTHCGPSYVRSGWGRVFQAMGHEFYFWNPETKSCFDAFHETDPDLFIGTTYDLDRATMKNIAARPNMKVALYASANGELVHDIDREKYPLVIASKQERIRIETLKKETGRPDFVFIHVTDKYLDGTMGYWRESGVEPVGILNAADLYVYYKGQHRPELACDVGFVGGYWGYKARNLDRYMLPLCHPSTGLNVKIFGNQKWPVHQYLGTCTDEMTRDLFASAKVCPSVSEPHSTDLGWDIIERPFKVIAAGGLCISDEVDEMSDVFTDDELWRCDNPKKFQELVQACCDGTLRDDERQLVIETGQRKVFSAHTYHDRVAKIFTHLGMPQEAARAIKLKQELLK